MGTSDKHKIDNQNSERRFRSTRFLFPANELELTRSDKLYADYDPELKDISIDARSAVEGKVCFCGTKMFHIEKPDELKSEVEGLKTTAKKGQEVPKRILDKMTRERCKNNDNEEE